MKLQVGFRAGLATSALVLAGCVSTPAPRISLTEIPPERVAQAQANLAVFGRAWSLVADRHYDAKLGGIDWQAAGEKFGAQAAAAKDEAALYAVLNAMLEPLDDSHTHAIAPRRARERRAQQSARTGFGLTRIDNRWVVNEVLPGSPAAEAGIQVGWIALSRNGAPLGARTRFSAAEGEAINWAFLDAADLEVRVSAVARMLPTTPRQEARELEGGFVYLRFDEFDGPDRRWLGRELTKHAAAPGAVIDLRRNPGGETFSLGITIGEFFSHRVDCGTFITRGGDRSVKRSWQLGSSNYAGKVAVLVDGATGSAAEIFSAVLQDHGRATIVGRQTAGAVLASRFHRLPDGGELQLSREDYVAPKGRRLEGRGVEPDVKVARTLADLRAGRDPDLEAALRALSGATARGGAR